MELRTVVGLSANSRMVAYCIMRGKTLLESHISLYKRKWNTAKPDLMVSRLMKILSVYQVTDVALVKPYEYHSNQNIESLLEAFTTRFQEQEIKVRPYYPQSLHVLCEDSKTKKALMQSVSMLYPELERLYQREHRNKNKYYVKLFEAVAAAIVNSRNIAKN